MENTDRENNRLIMSVHDLERCQTFLRELTTQIYGTHTYEALLLTSIIFYARPFSSNERDVNAKAASRVSPAVLSDLSEEERNLHNMLLLIRNKAIAHAEWTFHPTGVTKNHIIQSRPFSIWGYFRGWKDIESFYNLAGKVLLKAHSLIGNNLR